MQRCFGLLKLGARRLFAHLEKLVERDRFIALSLVKLCQLLPFVHGLLEFTQELAFLVAAHLFNNHVRKHAVQLACRLLALRDGSTRVVFIEVSL